MGQRVGRGEWTGWGRTRVNPLKWNLNSQMCGGWRVGEDFSHGRQRVATVRPTWLRLEVVQAATAATHAATDWAMKFWGIQCLPPTAKGSGGNGVSLNHCRSRWVTASLLPRFSTREGQVGGIKNPFCSSARYHSLALHNPLNPPRLRDNANRERTSGSGNIASCVQA